LAEIDLAKLELEKTGFEKHHAGIANPQTNLQT